jgi:hypothetical protein
MFRWLQSLFSSPAAVQPLPAAVPTHRRLRRSYALARALACACAFPAACSRDAGHGPRLVRAAGTDQRRLERLAVRPRRRRRPGTLRPETKVLEALAAILASQQSGAALVRRMPGLIPQLLQSLRSETFSGSALSRTISSDPVLVAAMIRLANSCYQGTGATIASVEQAVILIGQEGLRQLITTVAFRPIVDVRSGFYVRRLAPHPVGAFGALRDRRAPMARRGHRTLRRLPGGPAAERRPDSWPAHHGPDGARDGEPRARLGRVLAQLARDTRRLCAASRANGTSRQRGAGAARTGRMRRGVVMSPLGRLLMLADYLGKVRMLVEQGLVDDGGRCAVCRAAARCGGMLCGVGGERG